MASHRITTLSEHEYLEHERASISRSEYIRGEVLAMSGGSARHGRLISRCCFELETKLVGSDCGVFSSDTRIRTAATGSYVYPDLSVVCGAVEFHQESDDIIVNPIMVVEVLSPSTRSYDNRLKFYLYREIESLKEYVMLESGSVAATHYSRQPDDAWIFREVAGMNSAIEIPSLDISLQLSAIYEQAMKIPVRHSS